jgi:Deoxyribonuclease NucA/NucB
VTFCEAHSPLLNKGQTNSAGDKMECDEYPFANAIEGGLGAWAACVSVYSNGAQGELLSPFLKPRHPGFKYEVVIDGIDCAKVPEDANPRLNAKCPCC